MTAAPFVAIFLLSEYMREEEKLDVSEAIRARHSVRHYEDKAIPDDIKEALQNAVNGINKKTGLHFQLITDEPEGFTGALAHYGNITGVKNYFVLAGRKKLDREVGYYGEELVLLSQMLGLNTCWVALTFNKRKAKYTLGKGEKLYMVIALGYGATQGRPHKSRPVNEIADINENSPEWYKKGIESVLLAPTAVNQQKFTFSLDGDRVISKAGNGFYTDVDLGIAQYHFDAAAGKHCFGLE